MLLFILGRQPEIGLAELRAVFGREVRLVARDVAAAAIDENFTADEFREQVAPAFSRLGSVVKVARATSEFRDLTDDNLRAVATKLFNDVEGKITLGASFYGFGAKFAARDAARTAGELKKILSSKNSVRLVPNDAPALSSATVAHNKLAGDNPKKREFIFVRSTAPDRIFVANTIFVQDIAAYALRDRGRPKRDAHVGMLPPKLAQTIINLALGKYSSRSGHSANARILLDPFCGTGVILQEAALMGLDVYGADLEPRMVDYAKTNLDWLRQARRVSFAEQLEVGDATTHTWRTPIDFIATETYLGKSYTSEPNVENLRANIATCNVILTKFLQNLHRQISRETGLCIAVPCWFVRGQTYHLPLIAKLTDLGYEQIFYTDACDNLIYHRAGQFVGRELLVLHKKSA